MMTAPAPSALTIWPQKALVVDSDPTVSRWVQTILRRRGVEVLASTRPLGLLSLVATHRPALLIVDATMRGLDLATLVRLLRSDPQTAGTTILLHSQLEESALAQKADECGADDYVPKSRGIFHLRHSLARWLGQ
jgi:CheY-like chemotaxis protein